MAAAVVVGGGCGGEVEVNVWWWWCSTKLRLWLLEKYPTLKGVQDHRNSLTNQIESTSEEIFFDAGDITLEEYKEVVSKYSIGWYKTRSEYKSLAKRHHDLVQQVRDVFLYVSMELEYKWSTEVSISAHETMVLICSDPAMLPQFNDPCELVVQDKVKGILIITTFSSRRNNPSSRHSSVLAATRRIVSERL